MIKILKKEKNICHGWRWGSLVLTEEEFYFEANPIWFTRNNVPIRIPLESILNVRAHKPALLSYQDQLEITYINQEGNEKEALFIHENRWNWFANGRLVRLEQNFFTPWVEAVERAREVKRSAA